jgi:hypothetical protein
MDRETLIQNAFEQQDDIYNKGLKPVPSSTPEIGIDTNNEILYNLIDAAQVDQMDINKLQSFTTVSRNRNELYDTLDYMSQDTTLASVLETYAEDATETNDSGDIVWCESDDPNIAKYVTFLLNSLNVNKNVYRWTASLCKYGDVYLRLYRESELEDKIFAKKRAELKQRKNTLNEDVNIVAYSSSDKYVHYLEQEPNPAQVFELTKFGKTAGYIKTHIKATPAQTDSLNTTTMYNSNRYRFDSDSNDVELFPATEWVHGCLEADCSRTPEEVELFVKTNESGETESSIYKVKRGESLLYDSYKTWRELMLLENSVLLNRVTQSSIVRVIGVEVGDMPKENVQPHLMNIKHLIEQKAAFDVGRNMSEYTNPGPVVNNIYIPTRNNQGVLSTQQIGGDVQVGELVDLDYYEDKLFGGLRIPKQYFGRTDDSAGFSGGQSLSIISSRYAKMIKRIQNVIIQMLTDAINLILIDSGNNSYINKFTLKMLAPTTQEEVDRRENLSSKVSLVSDIMNALSDIDDATKKLKILKSLLSDTINNTEVISILQEHIDKLEADQEAENQPAVEDTEGSTSEESDVDLSDLYSEPSSEVSSTSTLPEISSEASPETETSAEEASLPSPSDLGIGDLSDSTNPEL